MIKVAAIQIAPIEGDTTGTMDKAAHWLDEAAAADVQLAVPPEGYLPGYAEIQEAKASGSSEALAEVLDALDPIPGPATEVLPIKGARILCGSLAAFYHPEPDNRNKVRQMYVNSHCSPTRAIDNSVWMVMANMCGWNAGLEFFGKSRIMSPSGEIVAEGGEGAEHEGLVVADIDPSDDSGGLPFRLIDRRRPDLYGDLLTPNPRVGNVDWTD